MKRRVIAALGAVLLLIGLIIYWHLSYGPTKFEKSAWLNGEQIGHIEDAPRLRMADGLLINKPPLGKSRIEVESMLGPPTKTDKFREYDLIYWLGPERSFISIDSEWLVLRLSGTGVVSDMKIVRD